MLGRPKKEDSREKQYRVRLNDKDEGTVSASERQIGNEVLYEFENVERQCHSCGRAFTVSGYIREYPIGAFNAESLKVEPTEPLQVEAKNPVVCRDCGAILEEGDKHKLCSDCREKHKAKWVNRFKAGAKIVGVIGVVVGTAYLATKGASDSDESTEDFEPESLGNDSDRKFKLLMKYPDGTEEGEDELFDSEEEAKEYGDYMISCSREGAETFYMSNPGDYPLEDYEDPDYEVIETG